MPTSTASTKPAAGATPKKTPVRKPVAAKPAATKPATAKPAAKPAVKTAAAKPAARKPVAAKKPVVKAVVKPVKPAKLVKLAKPAEAADAPKLKKSKLVRDSFSMPEPEYAVLGQVKKACLKAGVEVKKSELLRIGVALIQKMDVAGLKAVLATLPPLKAGRPKSK